MEQRNGELVVIFQLGTLVVTQVVDSQIPACKLAAQC